MTVQRKTFEGGRALLIGIGKGYPGRLALPDVVRKDAEGLGAVLRDPTFCGYPMEQVRLLLDEEATRINILDSLRELVKASQPDDTVIIFFSGHGGKKVGASDAPGYLCPVDYVVGKADETGIGADELSDLVNAIPAARVLLILDACHAEAAAFMKSEDADKGLLPTGLRAPAFEKLAAGAGRAVIASCKEDEKSWTYIAKDHSLFTYFLLEGLRGSAPSVDDDGLVRLLDLFIYLDKQVPANPKGGKSQQPVLLARAENNFPIALRRGGWFKSADESAGEEQPGTSDRAESQPPDWRRLEKVLAGLYPTGPQHDAIWSRAGGDLSTLALIGNGRAGWHAAITTLSKGGGGANISSKSLIAEALEDFAGNADLLDLAAS